jgi:hypothetical protein
LVGGEEVVILSFCVALAAHLAELPLDGCDFVPTAKLQGFCRHVFSIFVIRIDKHLIIDVEVAITNSLSLKLLPINPMGND